MARRATSGLIVPSHLAGDGATRPFHDLELSRLAAIAHRQRVQMMAFTQAFEAAGAASSRGTVVTSGASAHALAASYTQLISSTSFAYQGFWIHIHESVPTTAHAKFILYLATGGAGVETELAAFMFSMRGNGLEGPVMGFIPLRIPSGSRLSANLRCSTGSGSVRMQIFGNQTNFDGDNASYWSRATTYGLDTTNSGGQAVNTGAVVNTKGAWTPITTSCANPIDVLFLMVAVDIAGKTYAGSTDGFQVDIAINTGPEIVVVNDIPIGAGDTNAAYIRPWIMGPFRLQSQIPATSRLSVRAQSSTTNAADRIFHASLLALDNITNPAGGGGTAVGYRYKQRLAA